ncbi:sensor histidine kinase [Polaribacter porphyrae]|uniref:sensor histidine kinase n=1 Tax=Polaribacter porphyrae TaxID=1137780 RepID=UPI001B80C745|nr:histidine kinase [Polaribacter porphyrae]
MKKYFHIPVLGILLGIAISYFLIYSEQQENIIYLLKDAVLASGLGMLITLIISKTILILNRFLPYQNQTGNRLFAGFITHFTVAFSLTLIVFYFYQLFFFDVTNFYGEFDAVILKLGIILLILTIIFEVIYFALYSYYSYSKFQIETVKQERKQIELQLKALKSQLSSHFLFNSLNTISSLIYKDENKAETFVRRLAKMYDFTLKSYHQKLITLQEEVDFVNAYIFLLQTRFQDKFTCSISIDDDLLTSKIPPLTLQMLVENAVKHNQLSVDKPLNINIKSTEKEIIIENNITETPKNITSFNIGLKNINTRYLLLINKAISVIRGENFTVKIPLIK